MILDSITFRARASSAAVGPSLRKASISALIGFLQILQVSRPAFAVTCTSNTDPRISDC